MYLSYWILNIGVEGLYSDHKRRHLLIITGNNFQFMSKSKLNSLPDLHKSKLNSLLDLCKSKLNSLPDLCKSKLNSIASLIHHQTPPPF